MYQTVARITVYPFDIIESRSAISISERATMNRYNIRNLCTLAFYFQFIDVCCHVLDSDLEIEKKIYLANSFWCSQLVDEHYCLY